MTYLKSGSIVIEDWRGIDSTSSWQCTRAGHKKTGRLDPRQKDWECCRWWQGVRPVQAMWATTLHGAKAVVGSQAGLEVRELSNAFTCFHQLPFLIFTVTLPNFHWPTCPLPTPLSSSEYVTSDLTERTVFQSSNPSFLTTYSPKPSIMSNLALENEEFP